MSKRQPLLQKQQLAPEEPLSGLYGWVLRRLGVPPWGQILVYSLVPLIIALAVFLWRQDKRLDKVESALQVLSSRMSPDDKDLILRLLSRAKEAAESGNATAAMQDTRLAAAYIFVARARRVPAPERYFSESVNALDRIEASSHSRAVLDVSLRTKVSLAEYRSSLNPQPALSPDQRTFQSPLRFPPPPRIDASTFPATVFRSELPEGVDFLQGPLVRSLANNIRVENITFVDGSQTLDGIHWVDVVFVNTHVKYEGGEVDLRNVRFVNCTFAFSDSARSADLADHIALNNSSIVIPQIQG